MSPGSSTGSYPAFARIGLRENPGKKPQPGVRIPGLTTIHNLVNKCHKTGSVQDKKRRRRRTVLTEETLDNIGQQLKNSPKQSLRCLSQQTGISYTSLREATKLLQ
ncbi:hypothetical protein ANN_14788, partial [Periplaneta americana]